MCWTVKQDRSATEEMLEAFFYGICASPEGSAEARSLGE